MSHNPAYLNGVMVGYGELREIIEFTEMWSKEGFIRRVRTGVSAKGEIIVPGECRQSVLELLSPWQHSRPRGFQFSGYIRENSYRRLASNIPVQILGWRNGFSWSGIESPSDSLDTRSACIRIQQIPFHDRTRDFALCDRCCYFMRGNPSICNAFHPEVGVSECADFEDRNLR